MTEPVKLQFKKQYRPYFLKKLQGQLFILSPLKGSIIQGKVIIRGRRIFEILLTVLTGSVAPNILFYYPFK